MTTHSFLSEAVVFLSGLDDISIMDSLQEEVALMPEGTTVAGVSIIGFFGFTLRFFHAGRRVSSLMRHVKLVCFPKNTTQAYLETFQFSIIQLLLKTIDE
jgi:hypothetical protein